MFDYKFIKHNLNNSIFCKYFKERFSNFTFMHLYLYKDNINIILDSDNTYIGFIWTSDFNLGVNVDALYLGDYEDYKLISYCMSIISFKGENVFFCTDKEPNIYRNLRLMGFNEIKYVIDMEVSNFDIFNIPMYSIPRDIEIHPFRVHEDKLLRCRLQNEIFHDVNRIPVTIKDLNNETQSIYYLNDGGFFIKFKEEYIGYGQIIHDHTHYSIVNLGIIHEYRGNGYGKLLTIFLMEYCKLTYDDIKSLKLKVDGDNTIAKNMYESLGFLEYDNQIIWEFINE
ncbi:MAG: GNAT family N-acetyltransferase [Clostridium sp.]